MIRMTQLLNENMENRVSLMKVTAIMEKMLPEVTKAQSNKLMELCAEAHNMAGVLNQIPYTIHGTEKWNTLKAAMLLKLVEIREEAMKLDPEKINVKPYIVALDEVIAD